MNFNKYLRRAKSPEDKEIHLRKLTSLLETPHWKEVAEEIEDMMIKSYESFDECKTLEEFLGLQGQVLALKKMANLNGLLKTVAYRQQRIRPPE